MARIPAEHPVYLFLAIDGGFRLERENIVGFFTTAIMPPRATGGSEFATAWSR
jgi:hypothetical protein